MHAADELGTAPGTDTPVGAEDAAEARSGSKLHQEAARYRIRAKEAEAALAAAEARLTVLQTERLHQLAGDLLADPADIALSGKSLPEFLTPEGFIDHEAVAAAAAEVIETRPGLSRHPRERLVDTSQGSGLRQPGKGPVSWAELFR
jgi:hypothetical protein